MLRSASSGLIRQLCRDNLRFYAIEELRNQVLAKLIGD